MVGNSPPTMGGLMDVGKPMGKPIGKTMGFDMFLLIHGII